MVLRIKYKDLLSRVPASFPLSEGELSEGGGNFSFLAPLGFLARINQADPHDPIRLQIIPRQLENEIKDYEHQDPLHERAFEKTQGLIQRYKDRCILKVTDQCAVHCRFCFRRSLLKSQKTLRLEEIQQAAEYLASHQELREVILTGGDPLMLPLSKLKKIILIIRLYRPDLQIRLGTRLPVVWPERIKPQHLRLFKESRPFRLSLHVNHPQELQDKTRAVIKAITKEGIEILSQTVLLKGINDNVETLQSLFIEFVKLKIMSYYLFALDPAPGTSHFRVAITKGLELMAQLKKILPPSYLPVFALDLPGGGGKLPVERLKLGRKQGTFIEIEDPLGRKFLWPEH